MAITVSSLGAKGARTRQALLEHAVRRFAADGFRGSSVSEIARDAGLTPAAAYAYFENKEALFAAAVDIDAAALIEEILPLISASALAAGWSNLIGALFAGLESHPLARRILAGLEPDHTERLIDIPALTDLRDAIAELLVEGQREGTVRSDIDPVIMASGLESVVMAIVIALLQTGIAPGGVRAAGVFAVLDASVRAR
jgi:AcrR family transcriptional regulator